MKPIVVLIAVILCMTVVSARNLREYKPEDEDYDVDQEKHGRDHTNSQMRHRRRSRQSYYNPYNPYYYDNRREEDLLSRILYQIEEISSYIKRPPPPPPPPQIIYIPIPYPVGQCANTPNMTLPPRFGGEDKNQNWGLVIGDLGLNSDDGSDGSRPINLDPVIPDEPTVKPPTVEHGSSQAGMTTPPPAINNPGLCKAAILVCCQQVRRDDKQQCFSDYGCKKTYSTPMSCRPEVVKRVIQEFAESYAVINTT